MPDFAGSKTQRANKYAGLRAPQTPQPGLQHGLHRKTTFCFSASTCRQDSYARHFAPVGNSLSPTAGKHLSGQVLYRAPHFPAPTAFLPAPAGKHLPPHIFSYQSHNPPPARNLHSGLTGQQPPANLIFPFSLLSFFFSRKKKETDFAGFHLFFFFSFFSYNSNPSISFAISFTALLAVQSVYSSAQATQWSYINATRSPVSLILALISAIFFSSSFFNPF